MTDPIDDTQPHRSADTPDDPDAGSDPAPVGAVPPSTTDPVAAPATPDAGSAPPAGQASEPPLRADPDRPADSGWREPPWFPPDRHDRRDRDRRPSAFAMVIGLVFIAVGIYYFLDRTLRIAMPRIQWGNLWPVVLIVIGVLVLLRSFQRKA